MTEQFNERFASALKTLQRAQRKSAAIQSSSFTKQEREILQDQGYIKSVLEGWYIATNPNELPGSTTPWYASAKDFVAAYCELRFKREWHLSPEQSIAEHIGNPTIPMQFNVQTKAATNKVLNLLHDTKLAMYTPSTWSPASNLTKVGNMRVQKLEVALSSVKPGFFNMNRDDAILALSRIKDSSDLIKHLLDNNKPVIAGRLVGAFQAIGRPEVAKDIERAFELISVKIPISNPFNAEIPVLGVSWNESPYVQRIQLMWQNMRQAVIDVFGEPPEAAADGIERILAEIEDRYVEDAYNSLSIEGYQVSDELIERVRSGSWNPESHEADKQDRNAMAARGYYEAHIKVKESIVSILNGKQPGQVALEDHSAWYQALFAPFLRAGAYQSHQLVGYRNMPVYIRDAKHVPLNVEAVRDAMPTLFALLKQESHPAVRAVLGHFIFVYIHPYMDGNGRTGRFLMNAMFVSSGYPWTVVRLETKKAYMAALNEASSHNQIHDFAVYIKSEMDAFQPQPSRGPVRPGV